MKLADKRGSRVKVPVILQMEAVECGVASLAMVLAYYGRYETLEKLRIECGVTRDGVKGGNIARTARLYGLEAQGKRCSAEDLRGVDVPVIIHWDFYHFLVLEGIRGDKVYLCDPAQGRRVVSFAELEASFTGILIECRPGEAFEKGGRKPSVFRSLMARLAEGGRLSLVYIVVLGLLLVVPGLVVSNAGRTYVDYFLGGSSIQNLLAFITLIFSTVILQALMNILKEVSLARLENYMAIKGAGQFLWHVLRLPVEFFNQRQSGDINSRMQSNNTVATAVSTHLARIVVNFITASLYLVVLFQYNVLLTCIGIVVCAINVLFLRYIANKNAENNRMLLQYEGKSIGWMIVNLRSIETIQALGAEEIFFTRIAGLSAKTLEVEQKIGRQNAVMTVLPTFLSSVLTALILMVGSENVLVGVMSMGTFVAFNTLMSGFLSPVNELVSVSSSLQGLVGDIQRLDDVLSYPDDEMMETENIPISEDDPDKLRGDLEISHLTFGYDQMNGALIEDFSLQVPAGSQVAFVGASGSGKSTLSKLITSLYKPWSGQILIDGRDVRQLPMELFTNTLCSVDQEICIFSGTIEENITLWDPQVPRAAIECATKDACIHEDILAMPGAYQYEVAEGGANLSGGQRQRIEIARALVGNPSVLVMDEATSALDADTEFRVSQNIRRRGVTTVLVAHRLSTIRDADLIVVLEEGRPVERGTHDELMALGGHYAKLIETEG